jgi:hypothetical protein
MRLSSRGVFKKSIGIVFVGILLIVPLLLSFRMHSVKNTSSVSHANVRLASKALQPPVTRVMKENTVVYRLYGRVIGVKAEREDGIDITFVLDADPLQSLLSGHIRREEKGYALLRYGASFESESAQETISGKELTMQALAPSRLLELGVVFPAQGISVDDKVIMEGLDRIMLGNWKTPPQTRMTVDFIGISGKM